MKISCILLVLFSALSLKAQDSAKVTTSLASEMDRLKVETVLIGGSMAIDEYPLWSPNSLFIACNVAGKWYKIRLTNIELGEATWHKKTIGMMVSQDVASDLGDEEQKQYAAVSVFNARELTTANGTKIELKDNGDMGVSLVVTKKGKKPKTLWTSGGENCHSLVLSPDGKYVAYLCEMNGLFVMKLN